MLERIVYVSRIAPGVGAQHTYDIVRSSHNRNSALGLTGGLLLLDGHFVQVLEGDRLRVRERYAAIARDPRHTQLELRQSVPTERPLFPGEWMALRHEADIGVDLRAAFGYRPGLPAAVFDGERIAAFVRAACAATADA